ncbi:UBP-type zinc finger domain-containing protein [Nocardia sp. 348MFTsu5.1]|uniref:UBP-type zinc finger domain-containing protein n=1 Tax=Nocardia sp. 348MFTsu5.1 TaxID=1172185 RepID=UPI0003755F50|nr:UBP-type zinc finger domain-containing protein [Nocardia sp. 348MFTsu5.1]
MKPIRRSVMHRLIKPADVMEPDLCPELTQAPTDPAQDPVSEAARDEGVAGCEDCADEGVHHPAALRRCLTCGHVACCDSSPRRHATRHFEASGHPVMRSAEPGESWRWCYLHARMG